MQEKESKMIQSAEINGNLMTYVEAGAPEAPTIVLLTGWAQDHRLFKNVVPHLANDFHVLSPDWRGHNPDRILSGDFTSADLADDVLALVEYKKVANKFHLISHSHGCWVNLEVCDRLGTAALDRTVVIDWLMEPHPNFFSQVVEGRDPARYEAARRSMFDEWASATTNEDVLNHIYNEMPSFGGEMWMRANREIETAYRKWSSPLKRMAAMKEKPQVLHIFSQPLAEEYREMQARFAAQNTWFHPHHLPGHTHFPSLENGPKVAQIARDFLLG
jgi:pimeloyl-ACP methyl ester carboxylesterase